MELFADDLYALLKGLNTEEVRVLGYSMGGRIALVFALKYPEIISGLVMASIDVAGKELKMSEEQAGFGETRVQGGFTEAGRPHPNTEFWCS